MKSKITQIQITLFLEKLKELMELEEQEIINLDTKVLEIDAWDSLTALSLIAMMKDEFNVELSGEDIRNAVVLGDFFDLIPKSTKN